MTTEDFLQYDEGRLLLPPRIGKEPRARALSIQHLGWRQAENFQPRHTLRVHGL